MDVKESFLTSDKKIIQLNLWLVVDDNSKFVRDKKKGKKKALENIEFFCLEKYQAQKIRDKGHEYILTIEYETDDELNEIIHNLYREMESLADLRHCFIDAEISTLEGEKSW